MRLTPVYEVVEEGWTQARLREFPGVITAAPTRAQAREQLVDALREYLLSLAPATSPDAREDDAEDLLVLVTGARRA